MKFDRQKITDLVNPNNSLEDVKSFLANPENADFNGVVDTSEGYLVHYAALEGNLPLVKHLLSLKPELLQYHRPSSGADVLQCAVLSGNLDLVNHLADSGADIHYKYFFGTSILFFALKKRHLHIFKHLVEKCGMDPCDVLADNGITALYMAMEYGDKDTFMYVLSFNPLLHNFGPYNYLAYAVRLNDEFYLKELLERNASFEIVEPDYRSAFSWAAEKGKDKYMEQILKKCKNVKPEPLLLPSISKVAHEYNALCYKWERLYDIYTVRYFCKAKRKLLDETKVSKDFLKSESLGAIFDIVSSQSAHASLLFKLPDGIFEMVVGRLYAYPPTFNVTNN